MLGARASAQRAFDLLAEVLDRLVQFGLLEERVLPTEERWKEVIEFRLTPLFDRFLRFDFQRQPARGPVR